MRLLILVITVLGLPRSSSKVFIPEIDKVEINHYYNPIDADPSSPTFSQVIFWRWYPFPGEFHVTDWVMLDSVSIERTSGGGGVITFKNGNLEGKRVKTKLLRETTTNYDPERDDQKYFPQKLRRSITRYFQPIPKEILDPNCSDSSLQSTVNP